MKCLLGEENLGHDIPCHACRMHCATHRLHGFVRGISVTRLVILVCRLFRVFTKRDNMVIVNMAIVSRCARHVSIVLCRTKCLTAIACCSFNLYCPRMIVGRNVVSSNYRSVSN